MRTLMYTFIFTMLVTSFISCSKESLVEDETIYEVASDENKGSGKDPLED
ncbi:hypothetical protein [Maribacter sp. 2304DJ31-5]